jgi:hypothetical protein
MKKAVIFLVIVEACRYFGGQSALDTALIFTVAIVIYWVAELDRSKQTLERAAEEFEARRLNLQDVLEHVGKSKEGAQGSARRFLAR